MKIVKLTDAKNNLSRYLQYVKRGGRIRILDRDTPIAEIVPIEPVPGSGDDAAQIASLARRGLARPGKPGPLPRDLFRRGPTLKGASVLRALLEERRSGR